MSRDIRLTPRESQAKPREIAAISRGIEPPGGERAMCGESKQSVSGSGSGGSGVAGAGAGGCVHSPGFPEQWPGNDCSSSSPCVSVRGASCCSSLGLVFLLGAGPCLT